ncbi:hypothetical protein [uncultured Tateyamaria sp.]|uniref:hypothetical protein n=1 Tax=Tateyamaria sp. 1078 TaxID=3417464 RepID=UPI00261AF083|nr:hypothetical protein [uncultured Tateyamaria sp.]
MSYVSLPRLFLNATAIGLTLSAALITALWHFNINGFYDTLAPSGDALLALVLIWVSNGLLFAAVQVGYAVHRIGDAD